MAGYGTNVDEDIRAHIKLANFVSSRKKNGIDKLREGAELLGEKARNAQESVKGDNVLCMKT